MKKILTIIYLLLIFSSSLTAQRMFPNQIGVEFNAGLLQQEISKNYYAGVGMVVHSGKGHYSTYSFEYDRRIIDYKETAIAVETYMGLGGYSFNLISDRSRNFVINISLYAIAGYEKINSGNTALYDGAQLISESSFMYGAGGGLSLETYLSDRWVLIISGRAKVLWNTSGKLLNPSLGISIRFNL